MALTTCSRIKSTWIMYSTVDRLLYLYTCTCSTMKNRYLLFGKIVYNIDRWRQTDTQTDRQTHTHTHLIILFWKGHKDLEEEFCSTGRRLICNFHPLYGKKTSAHNLFYDIILVLFWLIIPLTKIYFSRCLRNFN